VVKRTLESRTKVHALMVQNGFDPSTPYSGALRDRRVNSDTVRMVYINNGATHGVMFDHNACVAMAEFAYLNYGVMPARDVVCQAAPLHSFTMHDTKTYDYGHQSSGPRLPPATGHPSGELAARALKPAASGTHTGAAATIRNR